MTKMQIVTVMLSALTCCCPVVQAGDAEKLARLCAANTAAVESIRTLYCKVKIESAMDRWHIPGGEYWRSGGMERYFFVHKGHENRCVIRDGVVKIMVKQDITDSPNMKGDKEVKESLEGDRYFWHAGIERYNGTSRFLFKPWLGAMCCTSDGGKSGNVTVAGFAANHAKDVRSVSQGHVAGVSTEVVEYRLSGLTTTVHFDPSANYMVRKSGSESDASTQYAGSSEVTSFKEYAPGVFFPERVVVKR